MRRFLFAATLAALAGAPLMAADDARPVRLEIQESGDGIDLIVTGDAGVDARFDLEVESKGAGGTTKTAQSGTSDKGGAGGVLLRSRIRTSGLSHWTARLKVRVDGREYGETRSNAG